MEQLQVEHYYAIAGVAALLFMLYKIFFPRRCRDCGTILLASGYQGEKDYCPNPECPPEA